MQTETKFVNFKEYCPNCKNWDSSIEKDPCNECLTNPTNINSHTPVNFEEKTK